MKPPVKVTVDRIEPVERGALVALFSLTVSGKLTLHECRLIQQNNQKAWCSPPQKQYQTPEGETKYRTLAHWPKEWADTICAAAWAAWQDYQGMGTQEGAAQ